jgi:hypothetical protein
VPLRNGSGGSFVTRSSSGSAFSSMARSFWQAASRSRTPSFRQSRGSGLPSRLEGSHGLRRVHGLHISVWQIAHSRKGCQRGFRRWRGGWRRLPGRGRARSNPDCSPCQASSVPMEAALIAKAIAAAPLRPNPSVKGTSTSGLRPLAAAPYLER